MDFLCFSAHAETPMVCSWNKQVAPAGQPVCKKTLHFYFCPAGATCLATESLPGHGYTRQSKTQLKIHIGMQYKGVTQR